MPNQQLVITAPDGDRIQLSETVADESQPSFLVGDPGIKQFYEDYGYVVVRDVLPQDLCDAVRNAFQKEVKPYRGALYRQPSSGAAERHHFSENGWMLNSILNIHDLDVTKFPEFTKSGVSIVTHPRMNLVVKELLQESATIVQTMYFEGNPETWPHQDTYYLDSTQLGRLAAAWIALEDIDAGAGRFFVYPNSHKVSMKQHGGDTNIAFNHERYKQMVIDTIHEHDLKCLAPALQAGDVLFWNSKTIHGSLKTVRPEHSRCSLTAHYVPASTGLLQFQQREMKLNLKTVGEFQVHHPKDQSVFANKLLLALESNFPQQFQFLKRLAIKFIVR